MAVDPICGMIVDERAAIFAERDGERAYFCSEHCRRAYLAGEKPRPHTPTLVRLEPEVGESAHRPKEKGVAAVDSQRLYICPMHPGVEQRGFGTCPKCGMALEPKTITAEVEDDSELREMTWRFWVAAALSLPVLLLTMLPMVGVPVERFLLAGVGQWLQLALTTGVVLGAGWPLLVRGWRSIVTRNLNMFTLIGVGISAAYFYSVTAVLMPGAIPEAFTHHGQPEVYFEAASVIVALVLLGQVLELRARQRSGSAIRELLSISPPTARLLEDGHETTVPLEDVRPGDRLKVLPGERVPVDGQIVAGRTSIDESMITGEAMPVVKQTGDTVIGGTLNWTGAIEMRADRVGAETVLAHIVQMVAEAQRSRAPIQRVADLVAAWFVPAVIAVAFVAFIAWSIWGPEPQLAHALVSAVSVLIIACPCALGLATPMSVMVGIGRGAREGVLIKDAEVLEVMERVDTLVVDKTGTLTEGRPRVTEIVVSAVSSSEGSQSGGPRERMASADQEELLRMVASVEQNSEHPLGRAIVEEARVLGVELVGVDQFESVTGGGVRGTVAHQTVLVGSGRFLREQGIAELDVMMERARELQRAGRSVVFASVDGQLAGLLAVADPIKPTTAEAINALHRLGLRVVMMTGDNERTARAIAAQLGIDQVEAGLQPAEKHDRVQSLRSAGHVVAMAGDGINDAPALSAADVGIAMGTGTDVAIQSASVTLVKGDLRGIVRAFQLSRKTMRNIRQNLLLAFIYNAVCVPVAAGVLVPLFGPSAVLNPMLAAAAMSFSSVSVIGNALRLRRVALG